MTIYYLVMFHYERYLTIDVNTYASDGRKLTDAEEKTTKPFDDAITDG